MPSPKSSFIEEIIYAAFGKRKATMADRYGSNWLREDIFNHRQEQREWTGSGVRIKMFKPCPK